MMQPPAWEIGLSMSIKGEKIKSIKRLYGFINIDELDLNGNTGNVFYAMEISQDEKLQVSNL